MRSTWIAMLLSVLLLRRLTPQASARVDDVLARIQRSIDRCVSIIEELLDYTRARALKLETVDLESRVKEIEENDRITVYTSSTIEKIDGGPGQFDVSLRTNGTGAQLRAGAIIKK